MHRILIAGAAAAALSMGAAQAQDRTTVVEHSDGSVTTKTVEKNPGGAPGGAAGGAIAGALVAGPVGAVVGGIAGATVGHAAAPPSEVRTYVTSAPGEAVAYEGAIEVGKPVAGAVTWYEVPKSKYRWAYLNRERVVVDENHNVVAVYTN